MKVLKIVNSNIKILIIVLLLGVSGWLFNYYGHHYSHTETYYECQAYELNNENSNIEWSNIPMWEKFTEYVALSKWFYGLHLSVDLKNLIVYFSHDECKKDGDVLLCYSNEDNGATNLMFNLKTNQIKATIRKDYRNEVVKTYKMKCDLKYSI